MTKEDSLWEVRDGLKGFSPRFGFAWSPTFGGQGLVFRGGFGIFKEMPLVYTNQLALESRPESIRLRLQDVNGLKFPFPFSDPTILTRGAVGDALIAPPVVKMPYTMQWTLSLERQLGEASVVKVNYIGARGVNIFAVENPNAARTEVVNGRHVVPVDRYTNPAFADFRMPSPISNQWYNGVQGVLEYRLRGGLRFNTSYTLARNIDNGGGGGVKGSENIQGTNFNVRNNYDRAGDKGLSAIHVKHNFIVSYTYEMPFGSGRRWGSTWPAVANYLLGGWDISGSSTLRSGTPTDIGSRGNVTCRSACAGIPDLIPGGNNNPVLDNWTPDQYFDYTQFQMQPPKTFGNLGRNTMIRPGVINTNFSLRKDNRIGEGKNLEFRAEFFNLLNSPNFGSPNTTIWRNDAGALNGDRARITTTSNKMRQIQFGLKLTF
ncbi:MAG: hypothetical protein HY647_07350 [Acidobacteria bacterium]|nr:hypothetical protein [Acidobacteriota bacterium]